MLEFFRKYQSYIFVIVTGIVIVTMSISGNSSPMVANPIRDQVVFTAIDGEKIRRSELDEMVAFIATDSHDKQAFGGVWGPNFLNSGVIREELLKTGLGTILAGAYMGDLKPDLEAKLQREKAYSPYVHPQAQYISQEMVWSLYAPKINENLKALKNLNFAALNDAFQTKVKLFLDEADFPAAYSRYIIQSQEKQYSFIPHDPYLDRAEFTLFGYRTLDDWFGPRFIRLSAQFIINASKIAEQKGYVVTKEEALADLLKNAQSSYSQNLNSHYLGVFNSAEYYNEQLRILGMDQSQAVKIWRQVMLFKRLFNDVGSAVFVDPLMEQGFGQYANETVEGEVYSLPKELQFADYRTMQKFEVYLNQIAKRNKEDNNSLKFPEKILSADEIAKRTPELVQKRYVIRVSEANKNQLMAKVSLKETWNFEAENWKVLKEKFPELAIKSAETRDERFKALDSLDDTTRARVDLFAKKEIVESHPEWLSNALEKSKERMLTVGLGKKGNHSIFVGLEDGEELIKHLDKAELNGSPVRFTADGDHYYLITVLDRSPNEEILTFEQANRSGILDDLLEDKLRVHFQNNKEAKGWKSFDEAKDFVADDYFEGVLHAIATNSGEKEKTTGTLLAPLRFYRHLQESLAQLKKDPDALNQQFEAKPEVLAENKLPSNPPLQNQWNLKKNQVTLSRSEDAKKGKLFSLQANSWTEVLKAANGELSFIYVKEKGNTQDTALLYEKMQEVQKLLGNEAMGNYMKQVVEDMQKAKAISLDYLNQNVETMEIPERPNMSDYDI
jgi:GcvH upstream region-like protein